MKTNPNQAVDQLDGNSAPAIRVRGLATTIDGFTAVDGIDMSYWLNGYTLAVIAAAGVAFRLRMVE